MGKTYRKPIKLNKPKVKRVFDPKRKIMDGFGDLPNLNKQRYNRKVKHKNQAASTKKNLF